MAASERNGRTSAKGPGAEQADVVIVGARCGGSAAAIGFARAGRKVIAIDRTSFPSDTLSTHLNFPSAVAEIARVGALPRYLRCGPPLCREVLLEADGAQCFNTFSPIEGINYGTCVPRPELDLAMVETAREAGVEVREKTSLAALRRTGDRVTGVEIDNPDGSHTAIDCKLVVGADGRRSTTAGKLGVDHPYRGSRNGRGCAFFYMDDHLVGTEWHARMIQFRIRETHTLIFPCPEGRLLVLFMGPAEEIPRWRKDADGMWARMLAENPRVAWRVGPAENRSKLRSTGDTMAFFRASSGPGWALTGDAGHFKDPIIGQGIRDAVRFGRLLGEYAGPALDDPKKLDAKTRAWEARRDRECLPTYHWGNRESRIFPVSPLLKEGLRELSWSDPPLLTQMFDRIQAPDRVLNPVRGARWAARAMLRRGTDRRALLAEVREELRIDLDINRERYFGGFRSTRVTASERPDFAWPPRTPSLAPVTDTGAIEPASPEPAREGAAA